MNQTLLRLIILLGFLLFSIVSFSQEEKQTDSLALELNFSVKGGFFKDEVILNLTSEKGAKILFTVDGSKPTANDKVYKTPLKIVETVTIRAVAYKNGRLSNYKGHTYFINEPKSTFPVVSIMVNPDWLFDSEYGLYMSGATVTDSSKWRMKGANFWSKREITIHTEIFETNQECVFRSNNGLRLFGGMSRLFPQKSMVLVARNKYGKKRIRHKIFGEEGLKKFKYLILRNGGSDFGRSHFRDVFMTDLVKGWGIDQQDYRPCHLYLNGDYWGIYNIREKINRFYIASHHDVEKDSISILEHRNSLKRGSRIQYTELLNFLKTKDLSLDENLNWVASKMDIWNFFDYKIFQIFINNKDAGGNIRYWKPTGKTGKWRWILYDTDWGFGLHGADEYKENSLDFHLSKDGPHWPNPPWSTFILRKLLKNDSLKQQFIIRFCDRLNSTLTPEHILSKLKSIENEYQPEMDRHLLRWNLSKIRREKHILRMEEFGLKRNAFQFQHLIDFFHLENPVKLNVNINEGGTVIINNIIPVTNSFEGKYFANSKISLKAKSKKGYKFSHWSGDLSGKNRLDSILILDKNVQIEAHFIEYTHPYEDLIIFNEICSKNNGGGDWIEIFFNTDNPVNIKGWELEDNQNKYILPDLTIQPQTYLILAEHKQKFQEKYGPNISVVGDLGFGINKLKEKLFLSNEEGIFIDSTSYMMEALDTNYTLDLLLPDSDNANFKNWEWRFGDGTPGYGNPYYLDHIINQKRENWIQLGAFIGLTLLVFFLFYAKSFFKNN